MTSELKGGGGAGLSAAQGNLFKTFKFPGFDPLFFGKGPI